MADYAATVLADSPVSFWLLNENTGATTAVDEVGANNGTYTGGVTLEQTGLLAGEPTLRSIEVDGSTGYVLGKSGRILSGLTNFSIEAWVKTTNTVAQDKAIYCERAAAGNDILKMDMISGPPFKLELVYRDDAGTLNRPATTSVTLNDGVRHHCVVTKAGTAIVLYQDGAQAGTGTLTASNTFTNTGVESRIAADIAGGSAATWPDFVQAVAVYNVALSSTQVADHFAAGENLPAITEGPETKLESSMTLA